MKKSVMRLDRSQVPSLIRYNPVGTVIPLPQQHFRKALYLQAGYTNFDVMCVGGAGGFSGRCVSHVDYITYESGGGGGGSIRYAGLLSELPDDVIIRVALAGSDGADAGDNDYGENGWEGGRTEFWHMVAEGGWGGWGGTIDRMSGGTSWSDAEGGDGGGAWSDFNEYPTPGTGGPNNGGAGNVEVAVTTVTGGGGGGQARTKINKVTQHTAGDGGAGASTDPNYTCPGQDTTSSMGGAGGGVNLKPITGVDEFVGSRAPGCNPNGVVIIKLS